MRFILVRQFSRDQDGHRYQFAGDLEWSIQSEATAWCVDVFGALVDPVQTSGTRWWTNGCHFWFRDEDDAFQFRIRWG